MSGRYLVGGYLSAEAVVNMFNKVVMETVNWPSISSTMDCLVRPVPGGVDLRMEIQYVFVLKGSKFLSFSRLDFFLPGSRGKRCVINHRKQNIFRSLEQCCFSTFFGPWHIFFYIENFPWQPTNKIYYKMTLFKLHNDNIVSDCNLGLCRCTQK